MINWLVFSSVGVVREYDLVKIENRSGKRSQKLDQHLDNLLARENRSRKSQNVSISSDSVYDSVAYDSVKTRVWESEAEA